MKRSVLALLGVFGVSLAMPTSAEAASFNCRYAKLSTEVAICQYETLSRLDEVMASKFFRLKSHIPYNVWHQVKRDQKGWLRVRNRCGYNVGCIDNQYRIRIQELDRVRSYY